MLYLVLLLVLGALALLVTALITSGSLWAWLSIALSVLAALALFVDWLRRPKAGEPAAAAESDEDEAADSADEDAEPAEKTADAEEPAEEPEERPALVGKDAGPAESDERDDDAVPPEEETDAADLLIVCELENQVIVVDEHPRYHLAECGWLGDKDTIPIAVSEARELGFTPCARCGPDALLAGKTRQKRRKASWTSKDS